MSVDPNGLDIEEYDDGRFRLTAELWWYGNKRHRIARWRAVSRRIKQDGWRCRFCGEKVPLFRRADAIFCREACRKKAARFARATLLAAQKQRP